MEDNVAYTQIHQQVQTEDEKHDNEGKVSRNEENGGVKISSKLDEKQSMEDTKEERHEIEAKIATNNKELASEKGGESKSNASKKPKQSAKRVHKAKTTVPQPFSLATEKRMSREQHGLMDLSSAREEKIADFQTKLSKSASFSHKAQPSLVAREASNLKRSATAKASSRPRAASKGEMNTKTENAVKIKDKNEVEGRYTQSNPKKQQAKKLEKSKLEKSFTFKASPLPSFYHRKDLPSKPEIKKIPATRPKSPVLGRHRNKSTTITENSKTENKGKSSASTGTSNSAKETSTNTEKRKTEDKAKSVAPTGISNSAKEKLNRLIKGTRKALNTTKETMKLVVSKA